MTSLKDKTVLIIGRGSGIARAISVAVSDNGGRVIAAGRHPDDLLPVLWTAGRIHLQHRVEMKRQHDRAQRLQLLL